MSGRTFPTADQIARAICAAAALTGEDPIECAEGAFGMRCRGVAAQALLLKFPEARSMGILRCVGWEPGHNAYTKLRQAKKAKWWREGWVKIVLDQIPDNGQTGADRQVEPSEVVEPAPQPKPKQLAKRQPAASEAVEKIDTPAPKPHPVSLDGVKIVPMKGRPELQPAEAETIGRQGRAKALAKKKPPKTKEQLRREAAEAIARTRNLKITKCPDGYAAGAAPNTYEDLKK